MKSAKLTVLAFSVCAAAATAATAAPEMQQRRATLMRVALKTPGTGPEGMRCDTGLATRSPTERHWSPLWLARQPRSNFASTAVVP